MNRFNKKQEYSAKEILNQLDKCAEDYTFPMLDNGYIYLVTSKLTAYRDEKRWVIIIEVVGYNYKGRGHNGINNCLHIFGNCIDFEPGTDNNNFLYPTDNSSDEPTFVEEILNSKIKTMILRKKEITINHNREFYAEKGIEFEEEDKIFIWEFLRGLVPEYENDFFATETEIRERIPKDLTKFLELKEWNHPDCADSELPSKNETFKLIAKALETGITELYKPTKEPNNHWKNWPYGGTA